MTAFPQAGEKWSVGGNSISAGSFFGTLNNFSINFKTNNVQRMTLTTAGFLGLGTVAPTVMFECTGNGKINNFKVNAILTVGNKISVSKIFSPAGIIDFEGSNLKTTAGISGASLTISGSGTFGNISANSFQNPLFAGAGSGLILSDANGSFQKLDFDGNQNTYLRGDGTFGFMPVNDTWKTLNGNIYTTDNVNVGIGIDSPIEKLDVNGNANIRGYLYVQDGVIIGKRIDGQRVNSDTIDVKQLAIKYAITDSLTSLKLATGKMAVSQDINIGERAKIGTNIVIDGLTNNITTPGEITAGSITAGTMNVTNVVVDSSVVNEMRVVNNLKIGNNSMVLGNSGSSTDNNIYTDYENEPLLIQSSSFNNNTILNSNNDGNVGIGTLNPTEKLEVNGHFKITDGSEGDGKVLTSDVNGKGSWKDVSLVFSDKWEQEEGFNNIYRNDGNVGLGVSTPSSLLHIKKNIITSINTNTDIFQNANILLEGKNSAYMAFYPDGIETGYPDERVAMLGFLPGLNHFYMANIPGHIILNPLLNVGIGTTDPTAKLEVSQGGSFCLGNANGQAGDIIFKNNDVETAYIWSDVNRLDFNANFLDRKTVQKKGITLKSNGNVGIGTTDPTTKLEVDGQIKINGGIPADGKILTSNADGLATWEDHLTLNGTGGTTISGIYPNLTISNNQQLLLSGNQLSLTNSNSVDLSAYNTMWSTNTNNIFNNNSGNVGIGTATPNKMLHVKTSEVGIVDGGGGTGDDPTEYTGSIRIEHELTGITSSIWDLEPIISAGPGFNTRFSIGIPDRTDMFTIKYDGNVGIGTDNPTADLEVIGTIKCTGINMNGNTFNNVWTQSGEDIFNSTSGNVGIGTSSNPTQKLEISGNTILTGADKRLYFNNTQKYIGIGVNSNLSLISQQSGQWLRIGSAEGIGFWGSTGAEISSSTPHMFINTIGKVGIGTIQPTEKFEVELGYANPEGGISINDNTPTTVPIKSKIMFKKQGIEKWSIGSSSSFFNNTFFISGGTSQNLKFLITENGSVGIGTNIPDGKLHIKGDDIVGYSTLVLEESNPDITFKSTLGVGQTQINLSSDGDFKITNFSLFGGNINYGNILLNAPYGSVGIGFQTSGYLTEKLEVNGAIKIGNTSNNTPQNGTIVYDNSTGLFKGYSNGWQNFASDLWSNGVDNNIFLPYGNVGIGTSCPSEKLTVNGRILATEIKVVASITCPDYVFAPDYNLLSLKEIENYVKQNNHLPDVPSAKDFEKNGQNLGVMNFVLLKKIEELTIHIIELNKKVETLEKLSNNK